MLSCCGKSIQPGLHVASNALFKTRLGKSKNSQNSARLFPVEIGPACKQGTGQLRGADGRSQARSRVPADQDWGPPVRFQHGKGVLDALGLWTGAVRDPDGERDDLSDQRLLWGPVSVAFMHPLKWIDSSLWDELAFRISERQIDVVNRP